MAKRETLLRIIADATAYDSKNITSVSSKALMLCDFIEVLTKGTKYEGDGQDMINAVHIREIFENK